MSKEHDRIIFRKDNDQKSILKSSRRAGLFLDRDGVINKDTKYLYKIEDCIMRKEIFEICLKAIQII